MKRLSFLSFALVCSIIMGMSLTSCGDDGPVISDNVQKSELTSPLFLFENPSTDLASTIINGFTFWSFSDSKAAECTILLVNTKPHLRCNRYENSWSLAQGNITFGSSNYNITKINALGVKAYMIGTKVYFASNLTVAGVRAEDLFTKGFTKERLWTVIEKAKAAGQPVPLNEE